jgi:hypothetical protein
LFGSQIGLVKLGIDGDAKLTSRQEQNLLLLSVPEFDQNLLMSQLHLPTTWQHIPFFTPFLLLLKLVAKATFSQT